MMSMPKPSWWSFGGGGDSDKLASAPSFSADAKKPSESNAPYPTTSTPNGYVITGSSAVGSGPATQAAAPVGPVIYGTTPAAPAAAPLAAPAIATAAAAPPATAVAPQQGPYQTLAGETIPPPGQPLPPLAPLSAAATAAPAATAASMPAMADPGATSDVPAAGMPAYRSADASPALSPSNFTGNTAPVAPSEPPAARMADARGFDGSAGPQPGMMPADAAYAGGRYGSQSASRFSGGGGTVASPASFGQPPAEAAFPPADAALPSNSPPAGAPVMQPASPGLLPQTSPQPPVRRPDPGYRPFKTGSYRPSRTILADETASPPGDVRTASFEEAAASAVQR